MIKKITTLTGEIAARHTLDVLPNVFMTLDKLLSEHIIDIPEKNRALTEFMAAHKKLGIISGLTAVNQLISYIFLIILGIIAVIGLVVYLLTGSFQSIKPFIISILILFFISACQIVFSCACLVKATFLYWKRPDFKDGEKLIAKLKNI